MDFWDGFEKQASLWSRLGSFAGRSKQLKDSATSRVGKMVQNVKDYPGKVKKEYQRGMSASYNEAALSTPAKKTAPHSGTSPEAKAMIDRKMSKLQGIAAAKEKRLAKEQTFTHKAKVWASQHKKPLLIGGASAVGGGALVRHFSNKAPVTSPGYYPTDGNP